MDRGLPRFNWALARFCKIKPFGGKFQPGQPDMGQLRLTGHSFAQFKLPQIEGIWFTHDANTSPIVE